VFVESVHFVQSCSRNHSKFDSATLILIARPERILAPHSDVVFRGMYSTCLFCNKTLGANETFETFPVGKRIAFDAAKGRLWVVCPHCERWNLSPLEERWEAIEL